MSAQVVRIDSLAMRRSGAIRSAGCSPGEQLLAEMLEADEPVEWIDSWVARSVTRGLESLRVNNEEIRPTLRLLLQCIALANRQSANSSVDVVVERLRTWKRVLEGWLPERSRGGVPPRHTRHQRTRSDSRAPNEVSP